MTIDFTIRRQEGIAEGAVFQFAEGRWTDPDVRGVAISMAAFDAIKPAVREAWPDWHGYCGVSDMPPEVADRLRAALLVCAASSPDAALAGMCAGLADWLAEARAGGRPLSLIGI